jgi:hypothetical protein
MVKKIFVTDEAWEKLKSVLIEGFGKEDWANRFGYAWEGNYFKIRGSKKRYSYLKRPDLKPSGVIITADRKLMELLTKNGIEWKEW